MAIGGVNDPVLYALLQRGMPNTTDNYNRMSAGLRTSGWQGGAQPVTRDMMNRARNSMETMGGDEPEVVDNAVEEQGEAVPEDYLAKFDEAPSAAKQPSTAQAPQSPDASSAAPYGPQSFAGVPQPMSAMPQQTPMPQTESDAGGMGLMAMLSALLGGQYMAEQQKRRPYVEGQKKREANMQKKRELKNMQSQRDEEETRTTRQDVDAAKKKAIDARAKSKNFSRTAKSAARAVR